jgi:hypothetical protein
VTRAIALLAVSLVAVLAAAPAGALAQDNPFLPDQSQPQQQQQQPVTPAPPPPDDSNDDGDLSPLAVLAIGAAVVLLIGGIWVVISRDARRHAPRRDRRHSAVTNPGADERSAPGAAGLHKPKSPRHRKPSRAERERRKRGRAR